ncbi:MAG: enolase C-terminal domain-like protein [Rhodospirillales bacterium]|jgi:mandelate racemase|nr:enolase C-terminal domain-like protein [Rhodospirillales bacterium]MDP6774900.1 enolase C-terminal domain-like protein [Rhodospirillales bacterium]
MVPAHNLTIREVRVRAVQVPLAEPLKTASGEILTAPLVLLDLLTTEGVCGTSYLFCYTPDALEPTAQAAANIGAALTGDAVVPFEIDAKLRQRFRLLGVQGLMTMAMAGIDMAAWDALARAAGLPLVSLLGGAPKPIPAYASYGMVDAKGAAKAAEKAAGAGFRAMKVKIGHADVATDLAVIRAVRSAVGDAMAVMVDYNQSLSVPQAVARTRALDDEGLHWIEEPTVAEDFEGHAAIADETATPIQMGENWWGLPDMAKCVAAGASDLAMIDVMKIGGVTGWLKAAALAEANGLPVSSHIFPEVSGHLLAITPTRHWLEHLDLAAEVLTRPVTIEGGDFVFPETPGTGIEWDEKAVARHEV